MTKLLYSNNIEKITNDDFEISSDGILTTYLGSGGEITIPNNITAIADNVFTKNIKITKVTFDGVSKVTTIGANAFYKCTSLTSIIIPSSVTTIGEDAFQYCISLTSIILPSSVTTIGEGAFQYCITLTSISFNTPSRITTINTNTFLSCMSLINIIIPLGVTTINASAFQNCMQATSIIIPSSVTTIENEAFRNAASLTSIIIPSSVTNIGESAFRDCHILTEIIFEGTLPTLGDKSFADIASVPPLLVDIVNVINLNNSWTLINKTFFDETTKSKDENGKDLEVTTEYHDIKNVTTLPNGIKKLLNNIFIIDIGNILVLNSDINIAIKIIMKYLYPSQVPEYNINQSGENLYINILNSKIESFYPQIEPFNATSDINKIIFIFNSESFEAANKLKNISSLNTLIHIDIPSLKTPEDNDISSLKTPDYINNILKIIILLLTMYILYMVIFKRVFI
jgi:hypothetical protein